MFISFSLCDFCVLKELGKNPRGCFVFVHLSCFGIWCSVCLFLLVCVLFGVPFFVMFGLLCFSYILVMFNASLWFLLTPEIPHVG